MSLRVSCEIDESMITQLLDQVQHIKKLYLQGNFSYFNLDNLVNLKLLSLDGTINESFNIELFKNLCNRIEVIKIFLNNIDDKILSKLFNGHNFSKLHYFAIQKYNIKRLKKEFTSKFPMVQQLVISDCNIEEIEPDAFSNLKQLYCVDLSGNKLKFIEKDTFLNLKYLHILDLSRNELTNIDTKFIGVRDSLYIILENNSLSTLRHLMAIENCL